MLSPEHIGQASEANTSVTDTAPSGREIPNDAVTVAATVGVVAVGVALFEVALLPGMVVGVAAMLAPKYVPKVGAALTPMLRSSVRGAYKLGQKTREIMAEAKEQVQDIVAEVDAESQITKPTTDESVGSKSGIVG
jgi:Protein of unknown function (DUF5132)